jgi:hypothetical protein
MAAKRSWRASAALMAIFACAPHAHADDVRCHIVYGGESFTVDATPTDRPYRVPAQKIGRYFEFKAVYVNAPPRTAAINLYVYAIASGEPVPIHQAKHRPPFNAPGARYGFTGLNFVYEPSKGSELQYWCEQRP